MPLGSEKARSPTCITQSRIRRPPEPRTKVRHLVHSYKSWADVQTFIPLVLHDARSQSCSGIGPCRGPPTPCSSSVSSYPQYPTRFPSTRRPTPCLRNHLASPTVLPTLYNGTTTPYSSMTNASFFSKPNLPFELRLCNDLPQAPESSTPSVCPCQTSGSIYSKRWPPLGLMLPGTYRSNFFVCAEAQGDLFVITAFISTVRCQSTNSVALLNTSHGSGRDEPIPRRAGLQ